MKFNISEPPIIFFYLNNNAKMGKTDSGDELHNGASSAAYYQIYVACVLLIFKIYLPFVFDFLLRPHTGK